LRSVLQGDLQLGVQHETRFSGLVWVAEKASTTETQRHRESPGDKMLFLCVSVPLW